LSEAIRPAPTVAVSNLTVYRQSGVSATFDIVLGSPFDQPISLYCYTTNGSARAPGDYSSVSKPLTFPPGAISAKFPVAIRDNGLGLGQSSECGTGRAWGYCIHTKT